MHAQHGGKVARTVVLGAQPETQSSDILLIELLGKRSRNPFLCVLRQPLALAVASAMGVGACAGVLTSTAAAAEDESVMEEVVVTGSRIKRSNLVSSSPVTQIDNEELLFQGTVRVQDMMRNLPQVYSNQNSSQSNGATGTATLNLRNLGDERTLVLINGRRMPAGSPISGGIGPDINQIPAAMIETVEVLTGGASATYGSDAVAGVVNFNAGRLRRH